MKNPNSGPRRKTNVNQTPGQAKTSAAPVGKITDGQSIPLNEALISGIILFIRGHELFEVKTRSEVKYVLVPDCLIGSFERVFAHTSTNWESILGVDSKKGELLARIGGVCGYDVPKNSRPPSRPAQRVTGVMVNVDPVKGEIIDSPTLGLRLTPEEQAAAQKAARHINLQYVNSIGVVEKAWKRIKAVKLRTPRARIAVRLLALACEGYQLQTEYEAFS